MNAWKMLPQQQQQGTQLRESEKAMPSRQRDARRLPAAGHHDGGPGEKAD